MLKILFLSLLFFGSLFADEKVEIYATNIDTNGSIINATNGVSVMYKDYVLTAQKAIYNKSTGILEMFDNIRATKKDNYKILGSYAKLNIKNKDKMFRPFFMLDSDSDMWMSSSKAQMKDEYIDINAGTVSGCNPKDPLWQMEFTSSSYNTQTKWLSLYNTRLYIYDIPVLYTPWFGYSLDTTRRTGLLMPSFGISSSEGFYYRQPIYIAESDSWDLELDPQIRTLRGKGIYSTFRFVDSRNSHGEFTTGYFKEYSSYVNDYSLKNDSHYGFNFLYTHRDFLDDWLDFNLKGQSSLYIDLNNMNDVDYINLAVNDDTKKSTATQVLSKINLFYNNSQNYYGAYFKYYKDLTKTNNDTTLQQLPIIQYHRYLETFLDNKILYSLDIQSNNIDRITGKKVVQTDFNLPVSFRDTFFDEYLNFSYTANLYAQHTAFRGDEIVATNYDYADGFYARNYHTFNVSTDLLKPYENYTHVVSLGMTYTLDGGDTKTGYYDEYDSFCSNPENRDESICEFYNISKVENSLTLDFSQYVYDINNTQILYHRLSQRFNDSDAKDSLGELENELEYKVNKALTFYNNSLYNYTESGFSKIYNKLSYSNSSVSLEVSHLFKDSFLSSDDRYSSYLSSSLGYKYNRHYSYKIKYNYDIQNKLKKNFEVGFLYQKRCWDFGIKYLENNRPVLRDDGADSVYDKYIYFTVALKPMMSRSSSEFGWRISKGE